MERMSAGPAGGPQTVSEPSAKTGKWTRIHPRGSTDCYLWLYKDPRGCAHGPYLEERMATWFVSGSLRMSLPVKRVCDAQFQPLGDMIKALGRVPFQAHKSRERQRITSNPGGILTLMSHSAPVRDADIGSKPFPFCNHLYQRQIIPRPSAVTRFLIGHSRAYDNLIASSHYIPLLAKVEPLSDLPGPSKSKGEQRATGDVSRKTGARTATVTLVRTPRTADDDDPVYLQRRQAVDRDFTRWSLEALSAFPSYIHAPTFFELLRDVDSNAEIREYVQMHLGDTSDAKNFAHEFIRKRAYWKWVTGREGPLDASEDPSPKEGAR